MEGGKDLMLGLILDLGLDLIFVLNLGGRSGGLEWF
jgi:hypothetical protein